MKPLQPDWLYTGPLVRLPADLLEAETQDYPATLRERVARVELGDGGRYARITLQGGRDAS